MRCDWVKPDMFESIRSKSVGLRMYFGLGLTRPSPDAVTRATNLSTHGFDPKRSMPAGSFALQTSTILDVHACLASIHAFFKKRKKKKDEQFWVAREGMSELIFWVIFAPYFANLIS